VKGSGGRSTLRVRLEIDPLSLICSKCRVRSLASVARQPVTSKEAGSKGSWCHPVRRDEKGVMRHDGNFVGTLITPRMREKCRNLLSIVPSNPCSPLAAWAPRRGKPISSPGASPSESLASSPPRVLEWLH
jgi:hypothetical protein